VEHRLQVNAEAVAGGKGIATFTASDLDFFVGDCIEGRQERSNRIAAWMPRETMARQALNLRYTVPSNRRGRRGLPCKF